ncbi:hypothetical protein [Burkholderia orbicola]|uniref:hypothetical protein n=1 Tax=Burkholderia orbicola TaxID=2978683 RepID=UPI002FE41B51
MIDTEKMKALAAKLRGPIAKFDNTAAAYSEAADAIDTLLAALEASDQKRKEAVLDAEKARDERNRAHVKLNAEWVEKTTELRAALEAAAAFQQAVLDPENQPSQHGTILLDMHKKEVTRLRAELEAREADRLDAGRYRWLRDDGDLGVRDIFGGLSPYLNAGLDAAIDAARAGGQHADQA